MGKITTLGIDLAKNVFQLHGVDGAGEVVAVPALAARSGRDLLRYPPPCLVGLEACGTAHFWAREIAASGHDVR